MCYSEINFCILALSLARLEVTNLQWGLFRRLEAELPPSLGSFAVFFFKNNLILGILQLKLMLSKRGIETNSAKT